MDLEMMRRLHKKVNIVVIITKADTLTQSEVKRLKANILRDVEANGIQLYRFPECDSDEDDEFKRQDAEMKQSIPFAVVGSNTIFEVGGKKFRGRQYPWGVVDGKLRHKFQRRSRYFQSNFLLSSNSRESITQRFHQAPNNAHLNSHARSQRHDPRRSLRKLPSSVYRSNGTERQIG